MEKEYDFFNGAGWEKVNAAQLPNVELEGLKEVIKTGKWISCKYENGRERVYEETAYGSYERIYREDE